MKTYTKLATAGAVLMIVSIVAGCGTSGGSSPSPASNGIATNTTTNQNTTDHNVTTQNQLNSTTSTPAANSSVTTINDTSGNVPAENSVKTDNTQPNRATVPTNTTLKVYDSVIANGHYVTGADLKTQGSTMVYSSYVNYMKSQYRRGPSDSLFYEETVVPYIDTNKKVYYIVNV